MKSPSSGNRHAMTAVLVSVTMAAVGCAVLAALLDGRRAFGGVVIGAVVVVTFLGAGLLPLVAAGAQGERRGLGAVVLLITYTTRLAVALVALALLRDSVVVDARWFGLSIITCALVWSAAQLAVVVRTFPRA